jgi:hypothetical protein
MPTYRDLSAVWGNIKEFELQPIRQAALRELRIALVGEIGSGRHTLAAQLRTDPIHPEIHTAAPLMILDLDSALEADKADLIILLLDAARTEFPRELELVRHWTDAGKKVVVFCNVVDGKSRGVLQCCGWTR